MAYIPRLWIANQVMHGVIRTVDRSFLLIPKKKLTNIIGACVGRALKKYPVQLHGCMVNTNHIHFLIFIQMAMATVMTAVKIRTPKKPCSCRAPGMTLKFMP